MSKEDLVLNYINNKLGTTFVGFKTFTKQPKITIPVLTLGLGVKGTSNVSYEPRSGRHFFTDSQGLIVELKKKGLFG